MKATFRPLDVWPGKVTPPHQRKSKWTFRAPYNDTLELLQAELEKLNATDVVIQCDVEEKDIRMDGFLRAGASPRGPGIIVSFESKHGPLRYATDCYEHWHCNLRAIALGLEALRKVERYGITKRGEQYTGWKQLGGGTPMPTAQMTVGEAVQFIADHAEDVSCGMVYADSNVREAAYRQAAKRLHPDAGGSTELFQKLQEAKQVLDDAA